MRTFKDVFSRKEERQNLKNVGFCLLVVLTLVVGSFALVSLQVLFDGSRTPETWAVNESSELADQQ